jgi:hypothetical protein
VPSVGSESHVPPMVVQDFAGEPVSPLGASAATFAATCMLVGADESAVTAGAPSGLIPCGRSEAPPWGSRHLNALHQRRGRCEATDSLAPTAGAYTLNGTGHLGNVASSVDVSGILPLVPGWEGSSTKEMSVVVVLFAFGSFVTTLLGGLTALRVRDYRHQWWGWPLG